MIVGERQQIETERLQGFERFRRGEKTAVHARLAFAFVEDRRFKNR